MNEILAEALDKLRHLFEEARKTTVREPAAMTLATADAQGRPSVRTMVVKQFDERGFVFFTNIKSRKGEQLKENPYAALCFFCEPLMIQVTIEGSVEVVTEEEADAWWKSRPRDNQFAAWASEQSAPLDDRSTLEDRLAEYHERFKDQRVPRAPHWSGYRLIPDRIEFWQTGWRRLHERICYCRSDGDWIKTLLYP